MPSKRLQRAHLKRLENDPPFNWQIVVIDQEPFRRGAAAACSSAMARLEEVRARWHRFEREDKPAFYRWRAREFGALLSKAREVEEQIRERQALIHEVEMEMRRLFQNAHTAYQRVMFRRENPAAAMDQPNESTAREPGVGRPLSDFEKEALFQDWVKKSLGTNPDKMDDEAYSTSFEAFKTHMFRMPREEPRPANPSGPRPHSHQRSAEEKEEPEAAAPTDPRVKELYRRLVRHLHPDLRADGSAAVSALWHEVQEAYAASDIARMEILLALSEIASDHLSVETSLGQMQSVLAELQRAWRALEKSVLEAQDEDAWNFARKGPNDDLRRCVQRQLQFDLAARMKRLELLTSTIDAWARGRIANRYVEI